MEKDKEGKLYNALMGIDPEGNFLVNYRKKHIWRKFDDRWCTAGERHQAIELTFPKRDNLQVTTVLSICADVCTYNYIFDEQGNETKEERYDLANFTVEQKAKLVLFATDWVLEEFE